MLQTLTFVRLVDSFWSVTRTGDVTRCASVVLDTVGTGLLTGLLMPEEKICTQVSAGAKQQQVTRSKAPPRINVDTQAAVQSAKKINIPVDNVINGNSCPGVLMAAS